MAQRNLRYAALSYDDNGDLKYVELSGTVVVTDADDDVTEYDVGGSVERSIDNLDSGDANALNGVTAILNTLFANG
jgi:hypothetical protein